MLASRQQLAAVQLGRFWRDAADWYLVRPDVPTCLYTSMYMFCHVFPWELLVGWEQDCTVCGRDWTLALM
jgi:hypothetical protein